MGNTACADTPCGVPGEWHADDRVRRQEADLGGPEHSRQLIVLLARTYLEVEQ